jgi:glycosyltransferase involved in cell wall biosynthesis
MNSDNRKHDSNAVMSIIIPTSSRAATLARALESVASVVDPGDPVEVIIVENGSPDGTAGVCKAIRKRFPRHQWRYVYDAMPGLLTGRHRGAKEARGDILCYLDDDVLLDPFWMEALKEAFRQPDVALVGGPSRPLYEVPPPAWLEGLWSEADGGRMLGSLSLMEHGSEKKPLDPCFIWGLNFAIRKEVLRECGGFHPDCIPKLLQRYQGDGETGLSLKIKAKGLIALYHPQVALTHVLPASRLTPEAFEQRAFYQGVCDSYTQIRRDGIVPSAPGKSWEDLLRPIKRKLERKSALRSPTTENVSRLMAHAYVAGAQFHQDEIRKDPKLLQWVLKPDYFDYTLPEGWEKYLH